MIAVHTGYEAFTHYANGVSGFGVPELDLAPSVELEWIVMIHQGTSSVDRLIVQLHYRQRIPV
jgi:hypothetical protein